MRTALVLLFLLALASVPGSLLPQRPLNPTKVDQLHRRPPAAGRGSSTRPGFFDVFAAPWFAAIYLLLFISLIGCVVPRLRAARHAPCCPRRRWCRGGWSGCRRPPRSPPPERPRRWRPARSRRLRGWRTVTRTEDGGVVTVAAEKGYLRETGNLIFHAALVVLLVGVAAGQLWGYQGTVLVTEGEPASATRCRCTTRSGRGSWSTGPGWPRSASTRSTSSASTYDPDGTPAEFRARHHLHAGSGRRRAQGRPRGQPPAAGGRRPGLPGRTRLRAAIHGHASRTARGRADVVAPFLPQDPSTLLSRGRGEAAGRRSSRSWRCTARSLLSPPSARTGR